MLGGALQIHKYITDNITKGLLIQTAPKVYTDRVKPAQILIRLTSPVLLELSYRNIEPFACRRFIRVSGIRLKRVFYEMNALFL